jgi:hypothetical protein
MFKFTNGIGDTIAGQVLDLSCVCTLQLPIKLIENSPIILAKADDYTNIAGTTSRPYIDLEGRTRLRSPKSVELSLEISRKGLQDLYDFYKVNRTNNVTLYLNDRIDLFSEGEKGSLGYSVKIVSFTKITRVSTNLHSLTLTLAKG